jgi:hypothetical protein
MHTTPIVLPLLTFRAYTGPQNVKRSKALECGRPSCHTLDKEKALIDAASVDDDDEDIPLCLVQYASLNAERKRVAAQSQAQTQVDIARLHSKVTKLIGGLSLSSRVLRAAKCSLHASRPHIYIHFYLPSLRR